MKKYITIILAIIMTLNIFCLTTFATGDISLDEPVDITTVETTIVETTTVETITEEEILAEDIFEDDSWLEDDIDFEESDVEVENTTSTETNTNTDAENVANDKVEKKEVTLKLKRKLNANVITFKLLSKNSPDDIFYEVTLLKENDFSTKISLPIGKYSLIDLTGDNENYSLSLFPNTVKINEETKTVKLNISEEKIVKSFVDFLLNNISFVLILGVLYAVLLIYRKNHGQELFPEFRLMIEKIKDRKN